MEPANTLTVRLKSRLDRDGGCQIDMEIVLGGVMLSADRAHFSLRED